MFRPTDPMTSPSATGTRTSICGGSTRKSKLPETWAPLSSVPIVPVPAREIRRLRRVARERTLEVDGERAVEEGVDREVVRDVDAVVAGRRCAPDDLLERPRLVLSRHVDRAVGGVGRRARVVPAAAGAVQRDGADDHRAVLARRRRGVGREAAAVGARAQAREEVADDVAEVRVVDRRELGLQIGDRPAGVRGDGAGRVLVDRLDRDDLHGDGRQVHPRGAAAGGDRRERGGQRDALR